MRGRILVLVSMIFFAQSPYVYPAVEDTIKLTFLGTGAPRPSLNRYGPSILVEAGDHRLLVDAGPGMRERFRAASLVLGRFDQSLCTRTTKCSGRKSICWRITRAVNRNCC